MPEKAVAALIVSTAAFIAGVVLGVVPHVRIAHRITGLQVFVADMIVDVLTKKKTEAEIQAEIFGLLGEYREKKGVITQFLVWAKWCLIAGGLSGVIALALKFLPTFSA